MQTFSPRDLWSDAWCTGHWYSLSTRNCLIGQTEEEWKQDEILRFAAVIWSNHFPEEHTTLLLLPHIEFDESFHSTISKVTLFNMISILRRGNDTWTRCRKAELDAIVKFVCDNWMNILENELHRLFCETKRISAASNVGRTTIDTKFQSRGFARNLVKSVSGRWTCDTRFAVCTIPLRETVSFSWKQRIKRRVSHMVDAMFLWWKMFMFSESILKTSTIASTAIGFFALPLHRRALSAAHRSRGQMVNVSVVQTSDSTVSEKQGLLRSEGSISCIMSWPRKTWICLKRFR